MMTDLFWTAAAHQLIDATSYHVEATTGYAPTSDALHAWLKDHASDDQPPYLALLARNPKVLASVLSEVDVQLR